MVLLKGELIVYFQTNVNMDIKLEKAIEKTLKNFDYHLWIKDYDHKTMVRSLTFKKN